MTESFFRLRARFVHFITASGALVSLFGYYAVSDQNIKLALILMFLTIVIDAIDGPLARFWRVKHFTPNYDGARLDYIVDFSSWVLLPAFFVLSTTTILPEPWNLYASCMIVLSSCFQFCCNDLKSTSSNFKRWPSAWSLLIVLLAIWDFSAYFNFFIILICSIFSFIPTYYPHPFQKNQISHNPLLQFGGTILLVFLSALFMLSVTLDIVSYPEKDEKSAIFQLALLFAYIIFSLYGTWKNRREMSF